MDSNKDESDRCIQLAEKQINDGQRDKALKYLEKAERLFPSQRAKDLIGLLQKLNGTTTFDKAANDKTKTPPVSPAARRRAFAGRQPNAKEAGPTEENNVSKDFSPEQLEAVQKVKRCKDYYEILGVTKDVADTELKKAYRKLALQFHPDKNKAPGASEAFKAIGNAFAVLSDSEKRKQYDLYGSDEGRRRHTQTRQTEHDYSRGFEGDIPAEELFNMFFGGNVYVRRNNRWYQQQRQQNTEAQTESGHNVLLQMMPILVLVCLSLMSSFFVADPPYSLTRSTKFLYERKTANFKMPYFVKENFMSEYQGSLKQVENSVEDDIISNLRASCFRERNYKESLLWRARNFRDQELETKAKNFRTPSCESLNDIYSRERGG